MGDLALDVDAASAAGHVAIVVEAGILWARTGAWHEPALVDVQNLDDLLGNVVDHSVRRRLPNGNDLRGPEHSVEVARPAAGTCLLATTHKAIVSAAPSNHCPAPSLGTIARKPAGRSAASVGRVSGSRQWNELVKAVRAAM